MFPAKAFVLQERLLPGLTRGTCSLVLVNPPVGAILPLGLQEEERERQKLVGCLAAGDLQPPKEVLVEYREVAQGASPQPLLEK